MKKTKRELIIEEIQDALKDMDGIEDENIFRSRTQALAKKALPAIVLEPENDSPSQTVIGFLDWSLTLKIMVFGQGAEPDSVIDQVINSLHDKIMGVREASNLVINIMPGASEWEFLDGDGSLVAASCRYIVNYRTSETNLES